MCINLARSKLLPHLEITQNLLENVQSWFWSGIHDDKFPHGMVVLKLVEGLRIA